MDIVGIFLVITGVGFGGTSLLAFFIFCFTGSFGVVKLDFVHENFVHCLAFDFFLSLLFFIPHSLFVRKSVKGFVSKFLPYKSYGLFFSSLSGFALWICIFLWQESFLVLEFGGVFRTLFHGLYIFAVVFITISCVSLSNVDILGARVFLGRSRKKKVEKPTITSQGPYGVCRHPLYLCMLSFIWSSPRITADRLLMNITWSLWIFIGTYLEELDLVREFGEEYIEYTKKVWMLVPYVI